MSRDQHARQNQNIKVGYKSFESVEEFKYLGTTTMNQFSISEEINGRKSGNTFYHAVRNLLSSSLLFTNMKFKIDRTVCVLFA
jgi:hypothetical protein